MTTANRLAHEKSPYLLQHAHNPVDWHPWGEEAFEAARRADRPIFLSVGYATCHWCHVMERESFEDPQVAGLMNETFINIKVDREERPDIDSTYMTVCQMLTGSGGWPLTIVMTPDGRPFFAATYIPRSARYGRPGMLDLVPRIAELWATQRERLEGSAESICEALRETGDTAPGTRPDEALLRDAYTHFAREFDPRHGGFGGAPKFPTPHNLSFLLRHWKRTGDTRALQIVEQTLRAMRRGGIYDQVGFGFHRYSTDERWLVPHFEKMLYDQALLGIAYIEAWQATGAPLYADTAREVFEYVLRDMTDPEGAFHSAEDADSEGEEGKFYVWTLPEVMEVLGETEGALVAQAYNLAPEGNFAEETTGERTGANIPHLSADLPDLAARLDIPEDELRRRLEQARAKLLQAREGRVRPLKDDKVLTDWNGLMIAALALGAQALDEPRYAQAAGRAADFILTRLRTPDGRLLHRYRDGEAAIPATLDDHAFLAWGLIELYQATFDLRRLEAALELTEQMLARFWDTERGGLFLTAEDAETVLVRRRETFDGAVPAGNSVAALNLLRLGRLAGRPDLEERAWQIIEASAGSVARAPAAFTQLLIALDFALGPTREVVIAGDPQAANTAALLRACRAGFIPNKVLLLRPPGDAANLARLAEYAVGMTDVDGRAAAYVCEGFRCQAPVTDAGDLERLLRAAQTPLTS